MGTKSRRFDFEWLIVSKRLIYTVVAIVVIMLLAGGVGAYIWTQGNPFKRAIDGAGVAAGARFDSFEGDVRVVRAETRETVPVRSDTRLYPGDIVQTQTDGRARISLADGSTLLVLPNSVITIGENTSAGDGQRANVRVAVDRGKINVRTEQQQEGTNNVVETPLTKNRLTSRTAATFGVREDKTEDIRVGDGQIETSTRNGETTTVRAGEYIAINQSGNVKARERLLDVPVPSAPRNQEKIQIRAGGTANVGLRWQRPAFGMPVYYRVEVATSPFFVSTGKVIERDQLAANEFNAGDLRPGNYFWRVQAVAASAQVSEWSDPLKFVVITGEGNSDHISISSVTVEYVAGNIYLVRGRTQPGNIIRALGREALAATDGSFQFQISAPKGTREITLQAEDPQGNKYNYRAPFS
ncbi:MAG TPA: FecR domain-containing protein [Pyrinomonadaceae bacterium]|jgi:hypothetical protein